MKITNEGFCIPGFLSLGKNIGIKKARKDFAILYSTVPCISAGVFTKNRVKGAPVYVTQQNLKKGVAQAVVVNSGNANVGTGAKGLENARKIAKMAADELEINKEYVLIASTGIIGKQLPMDKFEKGITGIRKQLSAESDFAEAILTTDKIKKQITVHGNGFKICGAAKGSGMIAPNMATMLAFIITDAKVESKELHNALRDAADKSFNMVNVDMDTSTSDMVLVMANGSKKAGKKEFREALDAACVGLAKLIAQDGEGATKLMIVEAINAKTYEDARKIAKRVTSSPLVKCALFGSDPNWGRILCAVGNSTGSFIEKKLKISINGRVIVENGVEVSDFDSYSISKLIENNRTITITIDLGMGNAKAAAYGCDMSYDYIKINAEYST
ncbi:bifunctional glutamate N-acetyltransferase/amino-acid acetyltransferase ArgJ [Candidatus Woesearchaeota archaeon]|nr:bifunctional glutamate N-acetyltransferase/amino-acid acetyltransferase ArgJ [Candidatus Woesearchaeota archaeon]